MNLIAVQMNKQQKKFTAFLDKKKEEKNEFFVCIFLDIQVATQQKQKKS